jgi:hypothetical protein
LKGEWRKLAYELHLRVKKVEGSRMTPRLAGWMVGLFMEKKKWAT